MFHMRTLRSLVPLLSIILCGVSYSQTSRVPTRPTSALGQGPAPTVAPTHLFGSVPQVLLFGSVALKTVAFGYYKIHLGKDQTVAVEVGQNNGFRGEPDAVCNKKHPAMECLIIFGFYPTSPGPVDETATVTPGNSPAISIALSGTGVNPPAAISATSGVASTSNCSVPSRVLFPTSGSPVLPAGTEFPSGSERIARRVLKDFGPEAWADTTEALINCYYSTDGQLAFFTQVKSIYNAMSASTTVTADIGSYNFDNGMRLTLGTNIQAGPSGNSNSASMPTTSLPTLSATESAQAAQNLFFGGNIYIYDQLPAVTKKDNPFSRWHFDDDILFREGVDVQNFNAKSTSATSPTTHFNAFDEAYWQYDANPSAPGQPVPLAIFLGGQYGYAYTAHRYAEDYGFVHKENAQVGDLSGGIVVTGQFVISVLREFGPSQAYLDSASGNRTVVNNFKSWSFGIQYQSKGLSTSKQ